MLYENCNIRERKFEDSNSQTEECVQENLEWKDKENILYFFGDSSCCGVGVNNIRLKLIDSTFVVAS